MESAEGVIIWIVAMIFAPFIALFYIARYGYLRISDPNGPASQRQPYFIETLALGLCIVWLGIIGAILYAAYT